MIDFELKRSVWVGQFNQVIFSKEGPGLPEVRNSKQERLSFLLTMRKPRVFSICKEMNSAHNHVSLEKELRNFNKKAAWLSLITAERPRCAVPRLLPCGNCEAANALSHCVCGNLLCSDRKQTCGCDGGPQQQARECGLCYAGVGEQLTIFEQKELRKLRLVSEPLGEHFFFFF